MINGVYPPENINLSYLCPMKTNRKTPVIKDMIKLGISPANAYRLAHDSNSQAALALIKLIEDLHRRGVLVVVG